MKRPLIALAGVLVAGSTAVGVYLAVPRGEEEAVSQSQSATATPFPIISATVPEELPSPTGGYMWYVTPPNDFGLPLYAIQVPSGWSIPDPFYGKFVSAPEQSTYEGPALVAGAVDIVFFQHDGSPASVLLVSS